MAAMKAAMGRGIAQIDFFYDVASPYSWMAFETLMRYRYVWDAQINLRPFFLGAVMQETGNKPPAMLKAKRLYMATDVVRMAKHHGVPLQQLKDKNAMYNTLGAQRLLTATSMDAPEELEALTRELWMRLWGGGGDISTAEGLEEACKNAGLASDLVQTLMQNWQSDDVKARLKDVTDQALKRGAFGAPWITVKAPSDEDDPPGTVKSEGDDAWHCFWGCDRFDVLAQTLGQPWLGPHPSSTSPAASAPTSHL